MIDYYLMNLCLVAMHEEPKFRETKVPVPDDSFPPRPVTPYEVPFRRGYDGMFVSEHLYFPIRRIDFY